MNVSLQRARTALRARRAGRHNPSAPSVTDVAHQALQLAYVTAGEGSHSDPAIVPQPVLQPARLYLIVMYCPGCMRGHVTELVREVPAGTPDARDLGVMQMRPWRTVCAAA